VLGSARPVGASLISIDYQRYAEAEAALGWLNWQVRIDLPSPQSPAVVVGAVTERLERSLRSADLDVVHLKVLDQAPTGYVRASFCGFDEPPTIDGTLDASASARHDLIINARAIGDPARLSAVVSECLDWLGGRVDVLSREAFRPSPPQPERRA
jgi:hypothetical protein